MKIFSASIYSTLEFKHSEWLLEVLWPFLTNLIRNLAFLRRKNWGWKYFYRTRPCFKGADVSRSPGFFQPILISLALKNPTITLFFFLSLDVPVLGFSRTLFVVEAGKKSSKCGVTLRRRTLVFIENVWMLLQRERKILRKWKIDFELQSKKLFDSSAAEITAERK